MAEWTFDGFPPVLHQWMTPRSEIRNSDFIAPFHVGRIFYRGTFDGVFIAGVTNSVPNVLRDPPPHSGFVIEEGSSD